MNGLDLIQIWVLLSWIWIPYSCLRLRGNASSLLDLPSLEGPMTMSIWLIKKKKIKEKGRCLITEKWSSSTVLDSQWLDCSNSCRIPHLQSGHQSNSLVPMNYYLGMHDKHNIKYLNFQRLMIYILASWHAHILSVREGRNHISACLNPNHWVWVCIPFIVTWFVYMPPNFSLCELN